MPPNPNAVKITVKASTVPVTGCTNNEYIEFVVVDEVVVDVGVVGLLERMLLLMFPLLLLLLLPFPLVMTRFALLPVL